MPQRHGDVRRSRRGGEGATLSAAYTDQDLDAAVAAGVIAPEAVESFRRFAERRRVAAGAEQAALVDQAAPGADEESFRLLTGFNDIFVSTAVFLVLAALAWLGGRFGLGVGGALVAAASWGLAEFFTRRRHMALPSILLLGSFVGAIVTIELSLEFVHIPDSLKVVAVGLGAALAAYLHWLRFKVPITVAAGVLAGVGALVGAVVVADDSPRVILAATAAAGVATFALALWWDAGDPKRETRRADVAFWLHLLAAPLIVHPAFSLLGLSNFSLLGLTPVGAAVQSAFVAFAFALSIYLALAIVALIVDRRALMVSSLAYLLYAMSEIFRATGALTVSLALSALIVGAGLLLLSAYWGAARRLALRATPRAWRARLPAV